MSRVPLAATRATGEPYGPSAKQRYGVEVFDQLRGAEMIARQWQLDRTRVDEFSLRSHQRAVAALDSSALASAVVPVRTPTGLVQRDENPRPGLSLAALAAARPLGDVDGVHRASNAAPFADAAAALLVTTPDRARQLGLRPAVRYRAAATIGADPVTVHTAVIPATELVLKKAGLAIEDIGAFEISEAFASVPLAWLSDTKADPDAVNAWGGAIAWGHPLGASGAILMTHLIARMRADGIRYGMQAMCEGGGVANATIVELLS
jgi:acetyl-CoA acyltransferase